LQWQEIKTLKDFSEDPSVPTYFSSGARIKKVALADDLFYSTTPD